jgi:hypothetical protein
VVDSKDSIFADFAAQNHMFVGSDASLTHRAREIPLVEIWALTRHRIPGALKTPLTAKGAPGSTKSPSRSFFVAGTVAASCQQNAAELGRTTPASSVQATDGGKESEERSIIVTYWTQRLPDREVASLSLGRGWVAPWGVSRRTR